MTVIPRIRGAWRPTGRRRYRVHGGLVRPRLLVLQVEENRPVGGYPPPPGREPQWTGSEHRWRDATIFDLQPEAAP